MVGEKETGAVTVWPMLGTSSSLVGSRNTASKLQAQNLFYGLPEDSNHAQLITH